MAKDAARGSTPNGSKAVNGGQPRKRLNPADRRRGILEAARKVFSSTGDPAATTMKSIAAEAGISEGIIYRHFESKEQLYFEAIVDPLVDAIHSYVEEAAAHGIPVDEAERHEVVQLFWRNLITSLQPIVPLLGLVLFGEPTRARQFYRNEFDSAISVLAGRWQKMFGGSDLGHPSREVALSVIGMALMVSVDARFNRDFDLDSSVEALDRITRPGFWPELVPVSERDPGA